MNLNITESKWNLICSFANKLWDFRCFECKYDYGFQKKGIEYIGIYHFYWKCWESAEFQTIVKNSRLSLYSSDHFCINYLIFNGDIQYNVASVTNI